VGDRVAVACPGSRRDRRFLDLRAVGWFQHIRRPPTKDDRPQLRCWGSSND
jgi:hypothetical protein